MNKIQTSHQQNGLPTSQKKLKFLLKNTLFNNNKVVNVLYTLRSAAENSKAAHILLKMLEQCISNLKNELKQKKLQFVGEGEVLFQIGRDSGFKRITFRAKGSRSFIEKHRAFVRVIITNEIKQIDESSNKESV